MALKKELEELKYYFGVREKVDCSSQEDEKYRTLLAQGTPLPDGVFCANPDVAPEYAAFYTVKNTSLSENELAEYIQYKQLHTLITIKKCVVFFTVLTIISLIGGAIAALAVLCS